MTDHPITPPPELVQQWLTEGHHQDYCSATEHAIAQAARWGADQELEACCEWLKAKEWIHPEFSDELQAARRPKPPSLKEQALEELEILSDYAHGLGCSESAIRRALERLQELENNG